MIGPLLPELLAAADAWVSHRGLRRLAGRVEAAGLARGVTR
jgi:hypothetical protein